MISTRYSGLASLASTVARAGVWPLGIQASQASFIWPKPRISVSQILAERILDLWLPACFSSLSIWARICLVCLADGGHRLIGDLAREIDGVAVDDGLAHARADLDTLNAHGFLLEDWLIRRARSMASPLVPGKAPGRCALPGILALILGAAPVSHGRRLPWMRQAMRPCVALSCPRRLEA